MVVFFELVSGFLYLRMMNKFITLETGVGEALISIDSIASISRDNGETMIVTKSIRKPYEHEPGFNLTFFTRLSIQDVRGLIAQALLD